MKTYYQFLNTSFSEEIKPEPLELSKEDPAMNSKEKRQMQIKKQVLLKKMQAVRAGAGADIVASYEPEGEVVEGLKQARKNVGADKCWDGYKAKGTKKKGGKEVPNCVKEGKKKGLWDNIHAKRKRGEKPAKPGDKDYPKTLNVEGAAWTKKSGKNPEGGLNEKGRKSYERENPGSDLKAPQPEGGSRKKSFCARMKGMRKRQKPSNNTGKDRLSLSLKKWKCNEEKISAFDFVKKKIEKEVGKSGYVSKDNPRKPQTDAEKAKVRAHKAKLAKQDHRDPTEKASDGRYSDRHSNRGSD
jgi:hypothetical protein